MTAQKERLFYEFLKECHGQQHPNESEALYIIEKLKVKNISQIIFDFGEATLRCILDYFEGQENYEYCALIRDKVLIHNNLTGNSITLKD